MHSFTKTENDATTIIDPKNNESQNDESLDSIVKQNVTSTIYSPIYKNNIDEYFCNNSGCFVVDPEPIYRMYWDGIGFVSYRLNTGFIEPFHF